ncbi:hypothetical protein GCM10009730_63590 [Streptomyces albidochromogenes]
MRARPPTAPAPHPQGVRRRPRRRTPELLDRHRGWAPVRQPHQYGCADQSWKKARAAEELLKASQPRQPRTKSAPSGDAALQNPVLKHTPKTVATGNEAGTPRPSSEGLPHPTGVPEPRPAGQGASTEVKDAVGSSPSLPWHDGAAVMDAVYWKLTAPQRSDFILRYFQVSTGVEAVIEDMRGTLTSEARIQLAAILQQVSNGLLTDG